MPNNDLKFLEKHGYVEGSNEARLAGLGIKVDQSKTGKNVNPKEFANYLQTRQEQIKQDPSTIAGYSGVAKGYEEGKKTFLDMLPSLQPRYQDLLNQLEGERDVARGRLGEAEQKEDAALKAEMAKRGLSVSDTDSFYAGQAGQLQEKQDIRRTESDLAFSKERLATEGQRGEEEKAIRSAVANLSVEEGKVLYDVINNERNRITQASSAAVSDKQFATSTLFQRERAEIADEQWEKTFEFTKSEAAADRALAQARLAMSGKKSEESDYAKDILTLTENAYGSANKFPGMDQSVQKYLEEKYPDKKDEIKSDIAKYFPEGWQNQGGDPVTPVHETDEWIFYSDGTRENKETGEVQKKT